ncbi:MAG: IS110 family transposase [Nitrososphaerota archaeon]|nr:IS110 family transposase [Nitrososphaerota archaeon]
MKKKRDREGMVTAALDLGDSESLATILSPDGDVVDSFSMSMSDDGYSLFASKVPKDARIAFEATTMAYPVSRRLTALGYSDITVAHSKELAWIVKSKKKNDRIDSLKIARLHMAHMLPESHLLSREEQVKRDLLIQRVTLGKEVGKMKLKLVAYLKREDVYLSLPESSDGFSRERREAIRSMRFGDGRDLVVGTMMDRLEFLERQCAPLEEKVRTIVKDSEDVRRLMSIKGVDFYLASSYIGDVNRFPDDDHLASFLGIIPESWDSANVKRRGHMSKEGPSTARWAFSVMTDTVMRHNPRLKTYYLSVKKRKSSGSLAHVATMRKLVRMIDHMLRYKENWRWEDETSTTKKLANLDRGAKTGGD